MRLRWVCLRFVGSPKWQNTEVYEPDECDTEFETDDEESVTCPGCGSTLYRDEDEPEEINQ